MNQRLYLAYGSNLCKANMRSRCPDARAAGIIRLNDCRLIFRGVADVIPEPGQSVFCGLWKISYSDERRLDALEGVGMNRYQKRRVRLNRTGEEAFLYVMTARGIMPPTERYASMIRQGYRDFNLDPRLLDAAIEYSWTGKDPCQETRSRRRRQLESGQTRLARPPGQIILPKVVTSPVRTSVSRCVDCGSTEEVVGRQPNFVCSICIEEREVWKRKSRR